jgi:hypothetical protein
MRLRVTIAMLAFVVTPRVTTAAVSVSMPVPADVQIALFQNIWKLDRNFDCRRGITLAIVYQESYFDSVTAKDDLLAAIARQQLHIATILIAAGTQEELVNRLREIVADVVYIAPLRAIDIAEIGRISRSHRFRTITGVPEYVEQGLAVGIGMRRDRPLIMVNLEQARAEGAALSSQLLALARIVGPLQ